MLRSWKVLLTRRRSRDGADRAIAVGLGRCRLLPGHLRAVCGEEHMSLAVISADGDHQDGLLLDDEVRWYELHDLRGKGRHSCG
jgi:hypothetical protein